MAVILCLAIGSIKPPPISLGSRVGGGLGILPVWRVAALQQTAPGGQRFGPGEALPGGQAGRFGLYRLELLRGCEKPVKMCKFLAVLGGPH